MCITLIKQSDCRVDYYSRLVPPTKEYQNKKTDGTADTTYLQDGATNAQSHCLAASHPQDTEQEKVTQPLTYNDSHPPASIADTQKGVLYMMAEPFSFFKPIYLDTEPSLRTDLSY